MWVFTLLMAWLVVGLLLALFFAALVRGGQQRARRPVRGGTHRLRSAGGRPRRASR